VGLYLHTITALGYGMGIALSKHTTLVSLIWYIDHLNVQFVVSTHLTFSFSDITDYHEIQY